jgi:hypothetical protein
MDAEVLKFVEGVRRELHPLNEKILNHPYLQALQAGRIERERLRLFAAQQSYIIESDLRSVALMVTRASSEGSRAFFLELLEGERAALKALDLFRAAVVAAPGPAVSDEPLPGAFAYCAFVAWLSLYASEAEFAGALLINLPVWGQRGRMVDAPTRWPGSRCRHDVRPALQALKNVLPLFPGLWASAVAEIARLPDAAGTSSLWDTLAQASISTVRETEVRGELELRRSLVATMRRHTY